MDKIKALTFVVGVFFVPCVILNTIVFTLEILISNREFRNEMIYGI